MDLNKACLKYLFSVPNITQLVAALIGFNVFSFLNASSGYNPIRMDPEDEERAL